MRAEFSGGFALQRRMIFQGLLNRRVAE
jgi:hypothetical protein